MYNWIVIVLSNESVNTVVNFLDNKIIIIKREERKTNAGKWKQAKVLYN